MAITKKSLVGSKTASTPAGPADSKKLTTSKLTAAKVVAPRAFKADAPRAFKAAAPRAFKAAAPRAFKAAAPRAFKAAAPRLSVKVV